MTDDTARRHGIQILGVFLKGVRISRPVNHRYRTPPRHQLPRPSFQAARLRYAMPSAPIDSVRHHSAQSTAPT